MALRGIQEYIARDANNIALVECMTAIEPSNTIIIYIGLCVSPYFSEAKRALVTASCHSVRLQTTREECAHA